MMLIYILALSVFIVAATVTLDVLTNPDYAAQRQAKQHRQRMIDRHNHRVIWNPPTTNTHRHRRVY